MIRNELTLIYIDSNRSWYESDRHLERRNKIADNAVSFDYISYYYHYQTIDYWC